MGFFCTGHRFLIQKSLVFYMEYTSMPNPTVQYPHTGVVRKLLNDKIISAAHSAC